MNITNDQLAPEVRTVGRIVRSILPCFQESTFRRCNRMQKWMKGRGGRGMRYSQIFIDRPGIPEQPLRLCVYQPLQQETAAPGVLWIHGGGYAIGVPEQDEGFIRRFVTGYGCTVVAPDYCLSVDRPYPAALEDCYMALRWMKENAEAYHIRTDQLMVGGDSAGGGLTAALTICARDRGEIAIAFQMPLYPMLDDRMITRTAQNNDAPVWNTRSNEAGWRLYLGELYGTEEVPPCAAPSRLTDFSRLPPAVTYVGSIEPFHDETVEYMEHLKQAGIPAEYRIFAGCFHGFDLMAPSAPQAREAAAFLMEQFDYAVNHYFVPQPKAVGSN
ncbi:MAG: alpha/beta hydrolase [Candidatus Onthomonas sp.]